MISIINVAENAKYLTHLNRRFDKISDEKRAAANDCKCHPTNLTLNALFMRCKLNVSCYLN